MNPFILTLILLAAWLVFILVGGAFIHGAQLLRRRERDHWRDDADPTVGVVINPDVPETTHVRGNHAL